jgi:hypothetical protein
VLSTQGSEGAAPGALAAAPAVVLVDGAGNGGGGGGGKAGSEVLSGGAADAALSVAPLLGAAAAVDVAHPRWLHVHVRPPARGLIKTVRVRAPPKPQRTCLCGVASGHSWCTSAGAATSSACMRAALFRPGWTR